MKEVEMNVFNSWLGNGEKDPRFFIFFILGLMVFVGIVAVGVFFIAVQGAEEIMVPNVRGKELTKALLELQVKELYPRIQLRYSQSAEDKGTILEQDPPAGSIVKAGRRIRLVVSEGVLINTLENYVGRDVEEVRIELQTLFASAPQPLLILKEPFLYEYSPEPPGTILEQSPLPGTGISEPMELVLVVSRGNEEVLITVPSLVGLSVTDALKQISGAGINFIFSIRQARGTDRPGTVAAQDPAGQALVTVNTPVMVQVVPPEPVEGMVFGLFRYALEQNPYPLDVRLEAKLPVGETRPLLTAKYPGGEFTVPYELPVGSVLVLSMLDREIYREEINGDPSLDILYLDQL
ncbi:MAG: PASTA domain-containing protein [Spirochaetaceae bacterium]|jgi:beta-lactam-binding protein with PASTA domain|nr:PASTA domain-containing protein [Spirochaetaceae bacterium]